MVVSREARQERIQRLRFDYSTQPKHTVFRCNLCAGEHFVRLTHTDRYSYPAQADGCLQCGLVFLNPVLTEQAYREFYSHTYRPLLSAFYGRRIDAESIQEEQRAYAAEREELLSIYLASEGPGTLLDIGGSTGIVAEHFARRFELDATVLDPSPVEINKAKGLGLSIIQGFIEDFEPDGQSFDLLTMCQTVDHLLDVALAMRKVRSLLKPKGIFFVDIVDFRAAYLRTWRVEDAIKIDHPYYLTEATIKAYLLRFGFEILRTAHASDYLHVSYVCRLADPKPDYLPPALTVDRLWYEIRMVQNTHDAPWRFCRE